MRRLRMEHVKLGQWPLDPSEAHHARTVLRLQEGQPVEVFDADGRRGTGRLVHASSSNVVVDVEHIQQVEMNRFRWTVAAAVPKGGRADWMIEKLSELGTAEFAPLITQRSVVVPEGKSKIQRWERLAAEAAKQSRRDGIMGIREPIRVEDYIQSLAQPAWYLSTAEQAKPLSDAIDVSPLMGTLHLLIGPEGGWTDGEAAMFDNVGLTPVSLGRTILRVETAAVVAAGIAAALVAPRARAQQHKG